MVAVDSPIGTLVTINGLISTPQLNGKRCLLDIVNLDIGPSRWTVEMLEEEEEEDTSMPRVQMKNLFATDTHASPLASKITIDDVVYSARACKQGDRPTVIRIIATSMITSAMVCTGEVEVVRAYQIACNVPRNIKNGVAQHDKESVCKDRDTQLSIRRAL